MDLDALYRRGLALRLPALTAARAALDEPASAAGAAVRGIAHALRGSGATYGFPGITAAAAAVEDAPADDLAARVDDLIALVRSTIAGTRGEGGA